MLPALSVADEDHVESEPAEADGSCMRGRADATGVACDEEGCVSRGCRAGDRGSGGILAGGPGLSVEVVELALRSRETLWGV